MSPERPFSEPSSVIPFENYDELNKAYPFEKYHKLGGTLALKAIGLPVLPGFVVNKLDDSSIGFLTQWALSTKSKRLSLRFDSPNPLDHIKLASLNPAIEDLKKLSDLIFPPVIGIFLAENDRYMQWHSVLTQFLDDRMRLDIVGPGFDAGDITRGKITPHETIEFVHKSPENDLELSQLDIVSHKIISTDDYKKSRMLRYGGIYATITNDLGVSSSAQEIDRDKTEKVNSFLASREAKIPQEYIPIGWIQLLRLYAHLVKLDTFREHYSKHYGINIKDKVLSASYLMKYGLVFWDLYDGSKYSNQKK